MVHLTKEGFSQNVHFRIVCLEDMLISMLGLGEIQGVVLREETPSPCVETWLLSEVRDNTLDSGELLWKILLLLFFSRVVVVY